MSETFAELAHLARAGSPHFRAIPRSRCVQAAREHIEAQWEAVRARHATGESGGNVLRLLTQVADEVVQGAVEFGAYQAGDREKLLRRVSVCALGGYGRSELCPESDLDICLLYNRRLTRDMKALNEYLMPFLWDIGFQTGYTIHSVADALRLARQEPEVYTTYAQGRLIIGDRRPFAQLQQSLGGMRRRERAAILEYVRRRGEAEDLPEPLRDLYAPEPDIKESVGGLRDYHAALWLILLTFGAMTLDDLQQLGHITPEEYLELTESLDFIWRIRNELHFHCGKNEDVLTFQQQEHLARVFGYGASAQESVERFMQDYYAAAQRLRWFLHTALRLCDAQSQSGLEGAGRVGANRSGFVVYRGQLCSDTRDGKWFAENPARLMEIFWECARRRAPLSYATRTWVAENLSLVNYAFRSSSAVRRYFVAICRRPLDAGLALREAAKAGLLGVYIPEFAAIKGIVRYEDFHSYPVDEHTLRAIEALGRIPSMTGSVAQLLQKALECIRDPHVLVIAILLHDLGKIVGESHLVASVRLAQTICARIGLPEEDAEAVEFLVRHHMLMSDISFYRDTDDLDIVNQFAETVKGDERLRQLLLLSYADLSAVGPGVWNEWKGVLLIKLFLKTERILLGRTDVAEEEYWKLPKAAMLRERLPADIQRQVVPYLQGLGERYFVAFSADQIARHLECLEEARTGGLALRWNTHEETGTSEVVVCTQDKHGLFAALTGSFASQLIDVHGAAPFTTPDGYAVDCFTVRDAANGRPLTEAQFRAVERVLRTVLIEGKDVQSFVDQSRRRLFALLQPRVPVPTRIEFDNRASATHTVIDIETGDRTGLLYDIASAMSAFGLDITSARIMTDVHRVRDAFYVRLNNEKITDETTQAAIRSGLEQAIRPIMAVESKGGIA